MVSAPIGQEYRRIFHGCLASASGVIHGGHAPVEVLMKKHTKCFVNSVAIMLGSEVLFNPYQEGIVLKSLTQHVQK